MRIDRPAAARSTSARQGFCRLPDPGWAQGPKTSIATDRKVIDVSGDGTSNQGKPAPAARDAAVEAGAVINGLTIFNRRAAAMGGYLALHTNPPGGLAQYNRENVIAGPGAFVVPIDDFGSFGDAMLRKLVSEIARS